MSPDPVERLKARVCAALDALGDHTTVPHVPEEAAYVLAAIVEELGVTQDTVEGVDSALWIARHFADEPDIEGIEDAGHTERARNALDILLRASRTENET